MHLGVVAAIGSLGLFACNESHASSWPQCQVSELVDSVTPFDSATNLFGLSLAAEGNLLAVGAPLDDGGAVDGGAVYLLRHVNGEWIHEAKVFATDASSSNQIGNAVTVSGDLMVTGRSSVGATDLGVAYVFRRTNGVWVQEQKLVAPDQAGGDDFGRVAAVDGDWIIVGARGDDDQGSASGSAYMWHHEGGEWVMHQKLLDPQGSSFDFFGSRVAIEGNRAVVLTSPGTPAHWTLYEYEFDGTMWNLSHTTPCPTSGTGLNCGMSMHGDRLAVLKTNAIEVFQRVGGFWVHQQTLSNADGGSTVIDTVGWVSINDDALVLGQPQAVTNGFFRGAAYLFRLVGSQWAFERKVQLPASESSSTNFGICAIVSDHDILIGGRSSAVRQYEAEPPPDCDNDGISDACEIAAGASDCNLNAIPDACEIAAGTVQDCNLNGVPDDPCELFDTYQMDAGRGRGIWGVNGTYDMIWLNQFNVRPGGQVITHIDISWADPIDDSVVADGTPATLMIYDDPNNDGLYPDAVLLHQVETVVRVPRYGEVHRFDRVSIPPTYVGEPTDSFFVGAMVRGDGQEAYLYRAVGTSRAGTGRGQLLNAPVGTGDIITLTNNIQSTVTDAFLLRAIAADCDQDRQLDLCEISKGLDGDVDSDHMPDSCDPVNCQAIQFPPLINRPQMAHQNGHAMASNPYWVFATSLGSANPEGRTGKVHVLRFNGIEWAEHHELTASGGDPSAHFGSSIAVKRGHLIVGADGGGDSPGSAHVFRLLGLTWTEVAALKPEGLRTGDEFGASVGFYATQDVLVGAPGDDAAGSDAGAVHYFDSVGGAWVFTQKLTSPSPSAGDRFGSALTHTLSTVFVGAPMDDLHAIDSGSVLRYRISGGVWQFTSRVDPAVLPSGAHYGACLAFDEDSETLVVGATGDDGVAPGAGAVYVYVETGQTWTLAAKLTAPDGTTGDQFGHSVTIDDNILLDSNRMIVGAPNHDGVGAAYVFERVSGDWMFVRKLMKHDSQLGDRFGQSVGLTFDHIAVGVPGSDFFSSEGGQVMFNRQVAADCNGNGQADFCDISEGTSTDTNSNGVPDECEVPLCLGDINASGKVNVEDLLLVIAAWGSCINPESCPADIVPAGGDDIVNVSDLLAVIGNWGPCP